MAIDRRSDDRVSIVDVLDWSFFVYSGIAAAWLAYVLLRDGAHPGWPTLLLVAFWIFVTYLVLPRLHGILTDVYVPSYFIGRTRTSDGLLGDPVNLALLGREEQLHAALGGAGWTRADDLGITASWHLARSVVMRQSYPRAPVSPLHLFGRQQDFAYQQEVAGSPTRRHHVRLWRCPEGWLLPGGFPVDWLGAATYDRRIGFSLFTLQVTHKIEEDIDIERDFVVATITSAVDGSAVRTIERFASGYHSRNGGGDRIRTDGDLPVVDVRDVRAGPGSLVVPTDSRDRRPATISIGAALAVTRALWYVIAAAGSPPGVVALLLVLAAIDVVLAAEVLTGRTWARLCLMGACAVTAAAAFVAKVGDHEPIGMAQLPTLGGSIIVLLALSSPRAREWSRRRAGR